MSALLETGRAGRSLRSYEIIDMHGHLGPCAFAMPDVSPAGLVATMDRIGVQSIVVSHMQCLSPEVAAGNREVLAAMRAFPDRILGYVALWPESEEAVRAEVEWALAEGFTGIKIHNANGFPYTHPAYQSAYQIANERRLPVVLHCWGGEREFAEVAEVAVAHPEASILTAHAGSQNVDGYLTLAREHPNVYLDLCLSSSPRGMVARLVQEAGVEKVVWGSDAYFFSEAHQIGKVLGADLPDEAKLQVLSGNAKRLLARILR
jgi:predicted TIM-barrel fold metal-dependent hydrolase